MAEKVDWNQLIGGGVALVLLIGGAYWYESRDQAPTSATAEPAAVAQAPPSPKPLDVEWFPFTQEYNANAVAFDARYRGKRIAFTTMILRADVDQEGHVSFGVLGNPGAILQVRDDDKGEAAKANPASHIAALCDYNGVSRNLIMLANCHVAITTVGIK